MSTNTNKPAKQSKTVSWADLSYEKQKELAKAAPMFRHAPENVKLPEPWVKLLASNKK